VDAHDAALGQLSEEEAVLVASASVGAVSRRYEEPRSYGGWLQPGSVVARSVHPLDFATGRRFYAAIAPSLDASDFDVVLVADGFAERGRRRPPVERGDYAAEAAGDRNGSAPWPRCGVSIDRRRVPGAQPGEADLSPGRSGVYALVACRESVTWPDRPSGRSA